MTVLYTICTGIAPNVTFFPMDSSALVSRSMLFEAPLPPESLISHHSHVDILVVKRDVQ